MSHRTRSTEPNAGVLYVVATPIGNMKDITDRALRVLADVDLIAAEDTRTVGLFLSRLGLHKRLISYFEGNEAKRTPDLVERLQAGLDIALVCEAGTPTISDPGARLVAAAVAADLSVVPIPGPSAVVAALSASGLPTDHFYFEGFLPKSRSKRKHRLEVLRGLDATLIFYESPKRTVRTLADMLEVLGPDRRAVLARELTKLHEEFIRGTLADLSETTQQTQLRGEIVILVEGASEGAFGHHDANDLDERIMEQLAAGSQPGHIARALASQLGIGRRSIYQRALELQAESWDEKSVNEIRINGNLNNLFILLK